MANFLKHMLKGGKAVVLINRTGRPRKEWLYMLWRGLLPEPRPGTDTAHSLGQSLTPILLPSYDLKKGYSINWKHHIKRTARGLRWWYGGWEFVCPRRRHGFDPRCRKIPYVVEQLSLRTTAFESVLWSPRATTTEAGVPQGPRSATAEVIATTSPSTARKPKRQPKRTVLCTWRQ